MSDVPEFIVERVFDAPRAMVWQAWTDPEMLARWYGPGVETIIHRFDLKPGGEWLNEMKWGEKSDLSKAVFQEIVPEEKMVWHHSSTDPDWNIVSSPMMANWPRVLLTVVTFKDDGKKTNVRLTWTPLGASEAEMACFTNVVGNMGKGWESGFAIMDEILVEMQG